MSTLYGRAYTGVKNLNVKGQGSSRGGILRFEGTNSSSPLSSTSNGLYVNASNQLIYAAQGVSTTIGSAGGGGTPSWETLYTADNTFSLTTGTWTIAGAGLTADVLTVTADAGTSGDAIQITHSGSGNDIQGTSNTWKVTAAGVGTLAGLIVSGTTSAFSSTGAAVWTLKDNDAAALTLQASGATAFVVLDTRNSAEQMVVTAPNGVSVVGASNTVSSLLVTNDTATTFGADANSAGVVVIRSTSLTTGGLLQLQTTEGTLNGGFYLVGRDVTGSANVYTIGENGVTVMAGTAGSNSFTMTAGDMVMSDGSITMTDADDGATFSVTNNTAASASMIVIAGSGTFTGTTTTSFMTLTASGLTSGTVMYMPVAAMTSGTGIHIVAATANFTTAGTLIKLDGTAAVAGNYITATTTGAYTGTGMAILQAGAATTGVILSLITTTGLTSGSLLRATSSTAGAIATNGAISIRATGAFTSTSNVGYVDVLASATTTGTVFRIASSAASQTATELLRVDASGFTTGYTGSVATFTSASTTGTGNVMLITSANSTAGTALKVVADSLTTGVGVLFTSSGTITSSGTGFLQVVATGLTSGSGIRVDLTEATVTTGVYFQAWDLTSAAQVASIGKAGAAKFGTVLCKDAQEIVTSTNADIAAAESGTTFYLNSATEFVSTLPAPAAGLKYRFVVSAAPSGASYTIVTTSGTDLIHGTAQNSAGTVADSTAGTAADTITFVDGVSLKGDWVELHCDGTSWYAVGFSSAAAAITFTQT